MISFFLFHDSKFHALWMVARNQWEGSNLLICLYANLFACYTGRFLESLMAGELRAGTRSFRRSRSASSWFRQRTFKLDSELVQVTWKLSATDEQTHTLRTEILSPTMSIRALRSIRNHFPRRTPTSSSKTVFQSDRGHFLAQGPRRFNWTHSSCAFSIVSSYSSRSIPPPRHCRSIQSSSTTLHPNSFQDSERADLFYHLLLTPPSSLSSSVPVFAVSFLPEPPASAYSKTVIGWLPAETPGAEDEAGLNDFKQNRRSQVLSHLRFLVIKKLT